LLVLNWCRTENYASMLIALLTISDFLVVAVLIIYLLTLDSSHRKALSEKESEEFFDFANDVEERNIAATTAVRVTQCGFTVGGFLFAGLFAAMFQTALTQYKWDIFGALIWVILSLVFGCIVLVPLAPNFVVKNVVLEKSWSVMTIFQFSCLIGAFIRMSLVILKFLKYI
jgi:hypothetical protein